jgi:hypothetical protein
VVVTEPKNQRILLGLKRRGFGEGLYNTFGGKLDPGETDIECARRELKEETGIDIPIDVASSLLHKVGTLLYTFEDNPTEMVMHLFRLNVDTQLPQVPVGGFMENIPANNNLKIHQVDPTSIRGCDETIPQWFDKWFNVPLHNMFADDSIWLPRLLGTSTDISMNGRFHFQAGGQQVNTILHYFVEQCVLPDHGHTITLSLEKRLFHQLHDNQIRSPSIKEFKECYAFCNVVRSLFDRNSFDVVIDVAGGHGALAALFLITTSARQAVVIDPAQVGKGSVQRAWSSFFQSKSLRYRHECLRSALPMELSEIILNNRTPRDRVLVVACHACQHLSEETLDIACRQYGVHAAVMPCCQKDRTRGSSWKALSMQIGTPTSVIMDLLLAGRAMSWHTPDNLTYDVRMKTINDQITPQNRIIVCRRSAASSATEKKASLDEAHAKLCKVYRRAHESSDE